MTERPILFSGPMVRALLAGSKTQTRRVVKPQPVEIVDGIPYRRVFEGDGLMSERRIVGTKVHRSPYGKPGDRLWVRETWREDCPDDPETAIYKATTQLTLPEGFKWKPSIFMPRWASRITLEVIGVHVERLQDISFEDAIAEGCASDTDRFEPIGADETWEQCARRLRWPQRSYAILWDQINAKRAPWASNPWVWCISFRRLP